MPGLFLDLYDRERVMDFIAEHLAYLPEKAAQAWEARLEKLERGEERLSTDELADAARQVGRDSWAARRALDAFIETQNGCDEEWRHVVGAVSAGTAHLLERFRHGTACSSLDDVLGHDESASAFRELERLEIAHVRQQVRAALWRAQAKALAARRTKAAARLEEIRKRLEALRALAAEMPWMQTEMLSKLERFEDDVYFAGHDMDPARLDEEVAYYRQEKELPSEE